MSIARENGEKADIERGSDHLLTVIGRTWANRDARRWRLVSVLILSENEMSLGEIGLALSVSRVSVLRMLRQAKDELAEIPELQERFELMSITT